MNIPDSIQGDAIAQATWQRMMTRLRPHAKIDKVQADSIMRYAHYSSVYAKAQADVLANGTSLKASNGIAYRNPNFMIMNQAQANLLKLGQRLHHLLDSDDA